jgi:hypothetical protein
MLTTTEMVPFEGGAIEALMHEGEPFVVVKRICETLGIHHAAQQEKLKGQPWAVVAMIATTGPDGKQYQTFCCSLETLPMWLAGINPGKVGPEARPTLVLFQCRATQVLAQHFLGKGGLKSVALADVAAVVRQEVSQQLRQALREEVLQPVLQELRQGRGRKEAPQPQQQLALNIVVEGGGKVEVVPAPHGKRRRRGGGGHGGGGGAALEEAMAWLRERLQGQSVRADQVEREARAAGLTESTLKRAKKRLHVKATRVGGAGAAGHWEWSLPVVKN